mgnify:CR=1 FL=1
MKEPEPGHAPRLICPPEQIFDAEAVQAALSEACGKTTGADRRGAAVAVLREAQKVGRAEIAQQFSAQPFDARGMTRAQPACTRIPTQPKVNGSP